MAIAREEISMTVEIIKDEVDSPVDTTPAVDTKPAPEISEIDALLREYDERQKPSELPVPGTPIGADDSNNNNQPEQTGQRQADDQSVEQFLQSLSGPDPRIQELEGQVSNLQVAEYRRQELAAFDSFAADLQKQMPSHVPPDYTRAKLEALAHNPEVALAWDLRNVDRRAAHLELAKVQVTLGRLPEGTTPQQIVELQNYAARLNIAINSHAILRKATHGILNDARKIPLPIDEEATANREMVAQALRGASSPVDFKEPPIEWGKLSGPDGRREVFKQFGFDPGWGH
jgi:hypothetical protein